MEKNCDNCKHFNISAKKDPCRTCIETMKDCYEEALCPDCAKKDAEIAELKASHEQEINVWIESSAAAIKLLESETKRADVAKRAFKIAAASDTLPCSINCRMSIVCGESDKCISKIIKAEQQLTEAEK